MPRSAEDDLEIATQAGAVARVFVGFVGEGFDVRDALQGLFDKGRRLREAVARRGGKLPHAPAEEHADQHHHRHGRQHDERELERGDGDHRQARRQQHRLPHTLADGEGQRVLHLREVIGKPAAEFAHAMLAVEGEWLREQPRVEGFAQIDDRTFAHHVKGQRRYIHERRLDEQRAEQDERDGIDIALPRRDETLRESRHRGVHEPANEERKHRAERHRDERGDHRDDEAPPIRTHVENRCASSPRGGRGAALRTSCIARM